VIGGCGQLVVRGLPIRSFEMIVAGLQLCVGGASIRRSSTIL
jgi:hypothetical protein